MATLKAWKRSVKMTSWWSMICEFLCIGGIQKGWEMDQFNDFEASNDETDPKIRVYAKKLSKIGSIENFHLSQKSKSMVK